MLDLQRFIGSKRNPVPEETHDAMLRSLNLRDLSVLATIRLVAPIVERHLIQRVRSLVASFHLPYMGTVDMLTDTGSIIGGSAALELVCPGLRSPRDLNLYCPRGAVDAVVRYLFTNDYVLRSPPTVWTAAKEGRPNQFFNINNGVKSLNRLKHLTKPSNVTVVESIARSPLIPILFSHNTFLMNYCDGQDITCLYPKLTFCAKGLHNRSEDFDRLHKTDAALKWERLGISLSWNCDSAHSHMTATETTPTSGRSGACQREPRSDGDLKALRMNCTAKRRTSSDMTVSWGLGYFKWSTTSVEYSDTRVTINSNGLEEQYSNRREHRRVLDWRTYWDRNQADEGETELAKTSFP